MKVSEQTLEALASITRNINAIEQLPEHIRQLLVEKPVETLAGLIQPPKLETQPTTSDIIEWLGTIKTRANIEKFVASEKFILDTGSKAKVKISYLGDNFNAWFLNGDGKIEEPIAEQCLRFGKLRKFSVDGPILEELGGEAKAETTLSEMWDLMLKQAKGEKGDLLTNGYANIFYIRDSAGVLRLVRVCWYDDGWYVSAFSVEYPFWWHVGDQVFSRNSVLESSEPSAPAQA
jgi:hypothetical protein